jgi:acyl-coenzyme A thioesterase PaaI-like protein
MTMPSRSWHGGEAPERLVDLGRRVASLLERMLRAGGAGPELDAALEGAAAEVERAEALLAPFERSTTPGLDPEARGAGARPYYVRGSNVGPHNPVFPELHMRPGADVSTARVLLGVAHEGPPGCVHGGIVALLFDQLLGQHNQDAGIPGMTGTLEVRYRRPVPLYTELALEARTRLRSGRKVVSEGRMWARAELVAEAEGIFVMPRQGFGARA